MSRLRELEKLLAYLEKPTDRIDRSPFRQFCQSTSLGIHEVFSPGKAETEGAGCSTTGRDAREVAKARKSGEYLENPTDRTDRSDPTLREESRQTDGRRKTLYHLNLRASGSPTSPRADGELGRILHEGRTMMMEIMGVEIDQKDFELLSQLDKSAGLAATKILRRQCEMLREAIEIEKLNPTGR